METHQEVDALRPRESQTLYQLVCDREIFNFLLAYCPPEHIRCVLEDYRLSAFREYVPDDLLPGVVAFCIRTGVCFRDDPKATLETYFRFLFRKPRSEEERQGFEELRYGPPDFPP